MARIDIELADGAKAGDTLLDLTKQANLLTKELKKLPVDSEEFINKSKDMQKVGAAISEIKNQIKGVGKEIIPAAGSLKALTSQADKLGKEIGELAPGTQEFITKSKELQGVTTQISNVQAKIKGTTEASNGLKDAFDKYIPFSGTFKKIGQELGFVQKGVGGLSGSFGILRTAIIATGIGALVVVLGSLISYFTRTQEGMDKVTAVTRPLSAIFERLKGVLQELGQKTFKQLSDAIDNPVQAIKDLGNSIVENVLNRFKALALFAPAIKKILSGDIGGGFKDLGNAVLQAGTGVENVIDKIADGAKEVGKLVQEGIDAGTRLDQLQKKIERAEIQQIVRGKELELIIKQQKAIVEDITKSYDERIAAAQKARSAQDEFEKNEVALLDLKIAKIREQQALNDTSREDEKELAELIAKRLEVQAKIAEQSIEFDKKISEIRLKQQQEEIAAQQQFAKEKLEAEKKLQEELKALAEAEETAKKERYQKSLEDLSTKLAEEQNIINEELINRQISEGEFILQSGENVVDFQRRKIQLIKSVLGEESLAYQQAYSEFLNAQIQFNADSQQAMDLYSEQQIQAVTGSLGVMAGFMGSMSALYSQGTEQYKSFATAAAVIATIQSSINAYSSAAAIPIIGNVLAPIAAAGALLAGYAQVRKINQTKVPAPIKTKSVEIRAKKEKGGMLYGPSHAKGGIPIEAEGGEFIFSRKATSALGVAELNRVNDYYTKFNVGGPVNPFEESRSQGTSSGISGSLGKPAWVDDLIAAQNRLIAAQDRRIDRIKVQNVATETEDVIKTINLIKEEANA